MLERCLYSLINTSLICRIAHTKHVRGSQLQEASDRGKATQRDRDRKCVSPGSKNKTKQKTSSREGNKHFFLPCGSAVQTSLGCGVTALFILRTARYKWPVNLTNLCINFPSSCFSKCGHSPVLFCQAGYQTVGICSPFCYFLASDQIE